MFSPFVVACLWLLFGGSHVGLAAVRGRLVPRLGEIGFVVFFYVVAAVSFAALVRYYAMHRFDGVPGLALAGVVGLRWPLMGVAVFGMAISVAGLYSYPRLPSALSAQRIRAARGIEKVSRHPFFAGMGLFALAHALLVTHLVGTVFFGGLLLFVAAGARHQDRKLVAPCGRRRAVHGQDTGQRAAP